MSSKAKKILEKVRSSFLLSILAILIITPFMGDIAFAISQWQEAYLNGLELMKSKDWVDAITEFQRAIEGNSKDGERIRFYGMRYEEYFPHMNKGICHYYLGQPQEAIQELQISLNQKHTPDVEKYLTLARKKADEKKVVERVVEKTIVYKKEEDKPIKIVVPEELKNPPKAKEKNLNAVAVVIGNRDYKTKDIPPVDFALQDASMVKSCLIESLGYREGNIIYEENASKGTFENIFGTASNYSGRLFEIVKPNESDVFIYYSGHGAPDVETRKGYFLPVDCDPNHISIGGFSLDLLYKNLAKLPARSITVVVDACFSGSSEKGLLLKKASPVGIIVDPFMALRNGAVITSSAGTELSSWYSEKSHGLFTYYFLLGLTGKADSNKDHQITVGELSSYIENNVPYMARELHNRKQTPTFKGTDTDKNRVLSSY